MPLEGISMLKRITKLKRLTEQVDERAALIHNMVDEIPHLTWDEIDSLEFENGVYLIFESGETILETNRIVRVGTHTKDGLLKRRLKNHYIRTNKDGSIFRKNIGSALLNKDQDEFLDVWRLNTSSPKVKEENKDRLNSAYKKEIEKRVSDYLRENTKFLCIEVDSKEERLRLEEGLIALFGGNKKFKASDNWLGNYHPDSKIRESYLWNKQGLNGDPLSLYEVRTLTNKKTNRE